MKVSTAVLCLFVFIDVSEYLKRKILHLAKRTSRIIRVAMTHELTIFANSKTGINYGKEYFYFEEQNLKKRVPAMVSAYQVRPSKTILHPVWCM